MKFIDKVIQRLETIDSHVCVGLDSQYDRLPQEITAGQSISQAIFTFNKEVVAATHHVASSYKSNVAFYAGFGSEGLEGLRLTNEYIKTNHPTIPLLADCKRSEMGESVKMVKQELFDWLQFDCVMVTPWFGFDTVRDYLLDEQYGVIVYVHDSNPTAAEFQDLELKDGKFLYEKVTDTVANTWEHHGNLFVEAGLTYPLQLKRIREIVGEDMPILTAGYGVQGGTLKSLTGLFGTNKKRILVNSSRRIIFPDQKEKDYFASVKYASETIRDEINAVAHS